MSAWVIRPSPLTDRLLDRSDPAARPELEVIQIRNSVSLETGGNRDLFTWILDLNGNRIGMCCWELQMECGVIRNPEVIDGGAAVSTTYLCKPARTLAPMEGWTYLQRDWTMMGIKNSMVFSFLSAR